MYFKYKCKNYWNYRVVTKIIPGQTGHDLEKGTVQKFPDTRVFSITEVYYNKNDEPNSYIESINILTDHESIKDLKWIHKKIKKAFKKPIIDLDDFPNEWIQ